MRAGPDLSDHQPVVCVREVDPRPRLRPVQRDPGDHQALRPRLSEQFDLDVHVLDQRRPLTGNRLTVGLVDGDEDADRPGLRVDRRADAVDPGAPRRVDGTRPQMDDRVHRQAVSEPAQFGCRQVGRDDVPRYDPSHLFDRHLRRDLSDVDAVGNHQHLTDVDELVLFDVGRGDAGIERQDHPGAVQVEPGFLKLRLVDGEAGLQHLTLRRHQVEQIRQFLQPLPLRQDQPFGLIHRRLADVAAPQQRALAVEVRIGQRQGALLDLDRGLGVGLARRQFGEFGVDTGDPGRDLRTRQLVVGGVDAQQHGACIEQRPGVQVRMALDHIAGHLRNAVPYGPRLHRTIADGARNKVHGLDREHPHRPCNFRRRELLRRFPPAHLQRQHDDADGHRRQNRETLEPSRTGHCHRSSGFQGTSGAGERMEAERKHRWRCVNRMSRPRGWSQPSDGSLQPSGRSRP